MGQYGRACLLDFIQISSSRQHVESIEKGFQHGVEKENTKHAIPKEKIELRNKFSNIFINELNKCH